MEKPMKIASENSNNRDKTTWKRIETKMGSAQT